MMKCRALLATLVLSLVLGCAQSGDIFPTVETSLTESEAIFPNPISLILNEADSQLYVANSNVDIFFSAGSLAVLTVDATDVSAPTLTATQVLSTPNFAGPMYFDGVDELFIPFRETSTTNSEKDTFQKFTLSGGEFSQTASINIADDPFGQVSDGSLIYVVSEDALTIINTDLEHNAILDLTVAEDANLDLSDSTFVESVALNPAGTRAMVTNRNGYMFVINLETNTLVQTIVGPTSTRDALTIGDRLFVVDATAEAVWVFDWDLLEDPTETPETFDDSKFVINSIGVGNDPNGMAFDADNNRLYVANSADNTISVIDTDLLDEIARVSVDEDDIDSGFSRAVEDPVALAVGDVNGETYVFVAGFSSNSIAIIRASTLEVVQVFPNNSL